MPIDIHILSQSGFGYKKFEHQLSETKCLQKCLSLMLLKYSIEELFTVLPSNTSSAKYKLLSRNLIELKN